MSVKSKYKLVIFDVDGVIVKSDILYYEIAKRYNTNLEQEKLSHKISQSGEEEPSHRTLSFKQGRYEMILALHESSWKIEESSLKKATQTDNEVIQEKFKKLKEKHQI